MSTGRLLAALTAIAFLAIVVPFAAVRSLHERRLSRVSAELDALAPAASRALTSAPAVNVLLGPGRVPMSADPRWLDGPSYPLQNALEPALVTPDPWGNGYVVNLRAGAKAAVWLLSAGPDGTLQTPFDGSSSSTLGDDVGRRLR